MRSEISIGNRKIGPGHAAYIIAEIGSNFDGNLDRAKELARRCKDVGADAYKIQNFLASKIVSPVGFDNLQLAFQAKWQKPVAEVYSLAEFPRGWVKELADCCQEIGIEFLSSPYDREAVDLLENVDVAAHKVGSGEIDNLEFLSYIARTKKPIILGVGAATMGEIERAVSAIREAGNEQIVLLQCVTNYPSPLQDSNLRAMANIGMAMDTLFGYSDHTIGPLGGGDDPLDGLTVPLGAVALGACVVEKHVTDDPERSGPDHPFAMTIEDNFRKMIIGIRAMERALGDGRKRIMESERDTVVIQRRGLYASRRIAAGEVIGRDAVEYLRPAIGLRPVDINGVLGKRAATDIGAGAPLTEYNVSL